MSLIKKINLKKMFFCYVNFISIKSNKTRRWHGPWSLVPDFKDLSVAQSCMYMPSSTTGLMPDSRIQDTAAKEGAMARWRMGLGKKMGARKSLKR